MGYVPEKTTASLPDSSPVGEATAGRQRSPFPLGAERLPLATSLRPGVPSITLSMSAGGFAPMALALFLRTTTRSVESTWTDAGRRGRGDGHGVGRYQENEELCGNFTVRDRCPHSVESEAGQRRAPVRPCRDLRCGPVLHNDRSTSRRHTR